MRDPYVYRTRDYGTSFEKITDGIPPSMLSYTKVIVEDTKRPGLLYAGTENAIYVSFNDGDDWQPLQNNLPHAPVSGIVVQEHFGDLVVRHLRPRLLDPGRPHAAPAAHPGSDGVGRPTSSRPATRYRFRPITPPSVPYSDPTEGTDPRVRCVDQLLAGCRGRRNPDGRDRERGG